MSRKLLSRHSCRKLTIWSASFLFGSFVGIASAQQSPTPEQTQNPNPDVTRGEVASFDAFLDGHPAIDRDLRSNPSLISNKTWVQNHPELQAYLSDHPRVRDEILENPSYFIHREDRYEARERDRGRNRDRDNDRGQTGNPDVTREEVASFDQFLDQHPEIDRQLSSNPSLVNNPQFLQQHPELQAFLRDHQNVRAELTENPNDFMTRERRYDSREAQRQGQTTQTPTGQGQNTQNANPDVDRDNRANTQNSDVTRGEVTSFDQFLDQHPQIDRQLTANPSLVNSPQYLQQHPELQVWLNDHQNVRAEITENPNDFMSRERRYDRREARQNQQGGVNYDVTRSEIAGFDQFLDRHADIDQELSANPSLINNQQYLQQHPGLQAFLADHPNIKEELTENPNYFMRREGRYDAMESRAQRQNQNPQNQTGGQNMPGEGNKSGGTMPRENRNGNPNPDLTQGEIASFDQFLDSHEDINKQLEKNPQLVNEAGYVKKHKALATYLNEHPAVREELTENPSYFMKRENRFELSERDRAADNRDVDRSNNNARTDRDRDIDRDGDTNRTRLSEKDLRETDKFLSKHKKIDKDLRKNPELANDRDYLNKHKDFASFLEKNPEVHEAARRNPSEFMRNEERFEHVNHRAKVPPQEQKENKSKAEKREETRPVTPH